MSSEFDAVYAAHHLRIMKMAWKLTCGVGGYARQKEIAAAGLVALWQAHSSYDPSRGLPFWQYANKIVHGTMVDEIRLSGHLSRYAYQVMHAQTSEGQGPEGQRPESQAQLPDKLQTAMLYPRSLEAARDVASPGDPEEDLLCAETATLVKQAFDHLRGNERRVIREYYFEEKTLLDIGRELGVTESRVCQIKMSALRTMEIALDEELRPEKPRSEEFKKLRGERKPRILTVNGVTKSLSDWAREKGIYPSLIVTRMKHGWSAEKAICEPVARRGSHGTSIRGSTTQGSTTLGSTTLLTKRALDLCGAILSHTGLRSQGLRPTLRHADETEALRADLAQLLREIEGAQ